MNGQQQGIFTSSDRHAAIFHVAFGILAVLILALLPGIPVGIRMGILVILYVAGLPVYAVITRHPRWLDIWRFALILSVFQVFPDMFLSAQLGVLVFAKDGLFNFGPVSGYMAGLWTVPFFIIIYIGKRVEEALDTRWSNAMVALAALLLFGGSEFTMWAIPSWYATNLDVMIGPAAVYILVPEILLGIAAYQAWRWSWYLSFFRQIAYAFLVMLFYLGSASWFYFVIERLLS